MMGLVGVMGLMGLKGLKGLMGLIGRRCRLRGACAAGYGWLTSAIQRLVDRLATTRSGCSQVRDRQVSEKAGERKEMGAEREPIGALRKRATPSAVLT